MPARMTRFILPMVLALVAGGCQSGTPGLKNPAPSTRVNFDIMSGLFLVTGSMHDVAGLPAPTRIHMEGAFDPTGRNEQIRLYVHHWRQGGPLDLQSAADITGTALNVIRIDSPENPVTAPGGYVEEDYVTLLAREFVESRKAKGLNIRLVGKGGDLIVQVPSRYLTQFMKSMDKTKAKLEQR